MLAMDVGLSQELLQRFMKRLDHIEYRMLRDQQQESQMHKEDLHSLASKLDSMERARRLEAEDSLLADSLARAPRAAQVAASHRGLGSLPQPAAPPAAPPAEPASTLVQEQAMRMMAQGPGDAQGDAVLTASPTGSGAEAPRDSPGRGAFSNALVKTRSPAESPPQRFDIASPKAAPPAAPAAASFQSPPPGPVPGLGSPGLSHLAGDLSPPGLLHGS